MADNKEGGILSQRTPITTALAVVISGVVFWVGRESQGLKSEIEHQKEVQQLRDKNDAEWKENMEEIIKKLTEIAEHTDERLDEHEKNHSQD